jgi:hypothetical protein
MSAPVNDDRANATSISGLSGASVGTNVDATIETSWNEASVTYNAYNSAPVYPIGTTSSPLTLSPVATVWYNWIGPTFPTPPPQAGLTYDTPTSGEVLFTTFLNTETTIIGFPCILQVFSSYIEDGIIFMNEVPYIFDEHAGVNGGNGFGATVSFIATTGTTYYIRVGARQGGATGVFNLSWKQFTPPTLGSCSACPPTSLGLQVGSIQLANVTSPQTLDFPTVPAGIYMIAWCKGVMIWQALEPYWSLQVGGGNPTFDFTWPEGSWQPGGNSYEDQGSAEFGNECQNSGFFITCGGTISLNFSDGFYPDNYAGDVLPMFQLIEAVNSVIVKIFTANLGSTSLTNTGTNSWSANFALNYLNAAVPPTITATLLNEEGITGASTPQSVTFTAGPSTQGVAFTFDANLGAGFCTAIIQLSACGEVIGTIEYPLYPTIVAEVQGDLVSTCGGTETVIKTVITSPIVSFADLGISAVTFTGTLAGFQLSDGHVGTGCTPVVSSVTNTAGLGTTNGVLGMVALPNGTAGTATYTVAISCASLPYPNFVTTAAVPA